MEKYVYISGGVAILSMIASMFVLSYSRSDRHWNQVWCDIVYSWVLRPLNVAAYVVFVISAVALKLNGGF